MLQVGSSVLFDSISTNKERLTNTFPGYHSRYHNLFQKFVSSSSWNTSCGKEYIGKRWRSFPAISALLLRHAEFIWGVFKRLQQWRFLFLTKWWTDDLLIDIRGAISLMELWVPSSSSWEQTSSSKIDAFSSVVAVTGRPLSLGRSVDPVSLIFFD